MQILLDALMALLGCIAIWFLVRIILAQLFGGEEARGISAQQDHDTKEAETWTKQGNSMK